ncbi:MAG: hypothetical protein AAGU76_11990 [Sedimentibacter sp.]|uniref:hypothetical protein n=1 Tax=Sedimentibacter sp. TaxID=1960295 RepID=UPI00315804E9
MKRILIPIDGTKRSMKTVELVKNLYQPDMVEITVVMVKEDIDMTCSEQEYDKVKKEIAPMISEVEIQLSGFIVHTVCSIGSYFSLWVCRQYANHYHHLGIEMFGTKAVPNYIAASLISYYVSGHNGIYQSQIIFTPKYEYLNDHNNLSLEEIIATMKITLKIIRTINWNCSS